MKQSIQLRQSQHLTMTPQLQQAIRLLQLSALDLEQEIQETLESNLMLEVPEDSESGGEIDATESEVREQDSETETAPEVADIPDEVPMDSDWDDVFPGGGSASGSASDGNGIDYLSRSSEPQTLRDYLHWQLNLTAFSDTDRAIATAIIDSVGNDGYLHTSVEEIHDSLDSEDLELDEVEAVLHRIQSFDPSGVAARSPGECLQIQLRQLPEDTPYRELAMRLVTEGLDLLIGRDQGQLCRRLGLAEDQLDQVLHLIQSLNPRPGALVEDQPPQYIEPDVIVRRDRGVWLVELNPKNQPRLRINPDYARLIRRADQSDDNTCLKNHLQEARWFLKSLRSRNETVLRVARKIVEIQHGFLEHGAEAMKPLILREVAEALEMHESTISRVTSQKYMYTPRGTFEFKYFFSSHVSTTAGGECSATAIRALIKKLVTAEPANKPLSDSRIAELLSDQGIQVARRTIAKYRESLSIPPSNERKRLL